MKIDWMLVVLCVAIGMIAVSLWRAHHSKVFDFNVFDLLMENGRVSKVAVAFMLVLGVTSWAFVNLIVNGKMTEGYFISYGGMWVTPLLAKILSGSTPSTTITTSIQQTEKTTS